MYGIIPRTIAEIFGYLSIAMEKEASTTYEISVNYFEIYKEVIKDLLSGADKLQIREAKSGAIYVDKQPPSFQVFSPEDIFKALMIGQQKRVVASTN